MKLTLSVKVCATGRINLIEKGEVVTTDLYSCVLPVY